MKREDAIWILELIRNRDARTDAEKDAVNAAIEALKAQLYCGGTTEGTTSDLISRQQALNALIYAVKNVGILDADDIRTVFKALPTIQPEPHEGHWINGKCNLCGEHAPFWCMASTYHESNFCPNCGAKMKGEPNE